MGRRRTRVGLAAAGLAAPVLLGLPSAQAARMPIYTVEGRGATPAQASALARELGLPDRLRRGDGSLFYVDSARFQRVPTRRLPPGAVGPAPDEDGRPTVNEAFDFDALRRLRPLDARSARKRANSAFVKAGLTVRSGPRVSNSRFIASDTTGRRLADVQLDTHVGFPARLGGLPLMGPGARAKVAFDPAGRLTLLTWADRRLRQGPSMELISTDAADRLAMARYAGGCFGRQGLSNIKLSRQLVYYAPSFAHAGVRQIVPHYAYSGTAQSDGEQVNLAEILVPAARTGPSVSLNASAVGATVNGATTIRGGTPPYSVRYTSCARTLDPRRTPRGKRISYLVRARPGDNVSSDTLTATVTDANGLVGSARRTVRLTAPPPTLRPTATVAVGGVRDFSTEWIGASQAIYNGAENAGDFADEMSDEGRWRFNFGESQVWRSDFVDPVFGGQDSSFADNVDLQWFEGHGNPTGFRTGQTGPAGYLRVRYDRVRWANAGGDMEWISLLGCNILAPQDSTGLDLFSRWGLAFRGAHMILGWATKSSDFDSVGNEFGDQIADEHERIRTAWAISAQVQYAGRMYGYLGPIGPNNETNVNDHVWGLGGSTSGDIDTPAGFWVIYGTV
jgi:Family of unknown function (DUF6345)